MRATGLQFHLQTFVMFTLTILVTLAHRMSRYRGLSVQSATVVFLLFGMGDLVRTLLGGMIGARLYKIKAGYMPLFCSITTIVGTFLVLWVIAIPIVNTVSEYVFFACIWLVCAFLLIFVVMYIGHDLEEIHLRMEKNAKEMKS